MADPRDPELQRDLDREELPGRRDARYRANIAFAIRQTRSVIVLVTLTGALTFGWPIPHAALRLIARTAVRHEAARATKQQLDQRRPQASGCGLRSRLCMRRAEGRGDAVDQAGAAGPRLYKSRQRGCPFGPNSTTPVRARVSCFA